MQRNNFPKAKKNGPNISSGTNDKKPYHSSEFRDTLPRRGRITLRAKPSENDVDVPETYNENKNKRPLPNRRRGSSRTGITDGSFIRKACGRNDKEGPCFDLNVQSNGYAWWYMDGISDDGSMAISIIAFIGSVFSPWYSWSGRKNPHNHCSLNVVTYGKRGRWTMTERKEKSIGLDANNFQIGPSNICWNGKSLDINFKEITIPHLDSLEGTISIYPEYITDIEVLLKPDGTHIWRPFAPISRIKVETNKKGWKWEGNAYLDGNFGTRALEQDFSYWTWSRLPFANHTTTFYDAELKNRTTTNIALKFSKDGSVTTLEPPPLKKVKRTKWFLKRVARSDQDFDPLQNKPLLDAPFYSRSELLTKINGEKTIGIHEALDMTRFTNPFIQPLLCVKIPRDF